MGPSPLNAPRDAGLTRAPPRHCSNKVADTGKRMFGSFLTKAKEQMNRLDEAIVRSACVSSART